MPPISPLTRRMPTSLTVVLVVLLVVLVTTGLSGDWFSFGVHVILFLGLIRGHEGARGALIFFGWTAVLIHLLSLGLALLFVLRSSDPVVPKTVVAAVLASVSGLLIDAFTLYTLHRSDVQEWMFERSLREGGETPPR